MRGGAARSDEGALEVAHPHLVSATSGQDVDLGDEEDGDSEEDADQHRDTDQDEARIRIVEDQYHHHQKDRTEGEIVYGERDELALVEGLAGFAGLEAEQTRNEEKDTKVAHGGDEEGETVVG